jgi:hypothetical protein
LQTLIFSLFAMDKFFYCPCILYKGKFFIPLKKKKILKHIFCLYLRWGQWQQVFSRQNLAATTRLGQLPRCSTQLQVIKKRHWNPFGGGGAPCDETTTFSPFFGRSDEVGSAAKCSAQLSVIKRRHFSSSSVCKISQQPKCQLS